MLVLKIRSSNPQQHPQSGPFVKKIKKIQQKKSSKIQKSLFLSQPWTPHTVGEKGPWPNCFYDVKTIFRFFLIFLNFFIRHLPTLPSPTTLVLCPRVRKVLDYKHDDFWTIFYWIPWPWLDHPFSFFYFFCFLGSATKVSCNKKCLWHWYHSTLFFFLFRMHHTSRILFTKSTTPLPPPFQTTLKHGQEAGTQKWLSVDLAEFVPQCSALQGLSNGVLVRGVAFVVGEIRRVRWGVNK